VRAFKYIISTVNLLFTLSSFAGGSGGGGVLMSASVRNPEIIFNMGQENGLMKFAYGQLQGNQWQIQKIQIPVNELTLAPEELSALEGSKITKDWAFVK